MWTVVTRPSQALWLKGLVPERVLDEYDGPRLFTMRSDQNDLLLAYLCAQDAEVERFLVVPTNDMIINDLEKSEIAVRDALVGRGWSWLVDRMKDGSISILGALDPSAVPEDALPTHGARLSPNAQPFLCLKMIGEAMAPKRVPASVIERAVKGVTSAARILTRYAQRRMPTTGRPAESFRRYYDLPVVAFAFGSFEIEFDRPTPDPQAQLDLEESQTLATVQTLLVRGLQWASGPGAEELPQTAESSAIVEALAHLAPSQKGTVSRVEVSGTLVGGSQSPFSLTRASGERIGAARKRLSVERRSRTYEGFVREFDKDKLTFILRNATGETLRVVGFSEEQYEDAWLAFDAEHLVTIVADELPGTNMSDLISMTFNAPDDSHDGEQSGDS
jgi:hypothetical protein